MFNFFTKVTPKLTADLKKPFCLENQQRIDATPVHKAVREAFVNLIIHSDYQLDAGTLKIIKNTDGFEFANPGILKLPIEEIFRGGNSKPRNPRMQTMFRMVGFGDNAGSGFPAILDTWKKAGWIMPKFIEDAVLNQVTLILKIVAEESQQKNQMYSCYKESKIYNNHITLIYHQPNEVMRVCELFPQKKNEKVRNINLTSTGWGTLCVADSIPRGG